MRPLFDPVEFARQLRVRIAERDIDQSRAAAEIGVAPSTICRICKGKSPSVEHYLRILRWLQFDPCTDARHAAE